MAEATDYIMSDMAPDMIEGWRGAMLTNTGGDTAVVYSDIRDADPALLLDRYASNLPTPTAARSWAIGAVDNELDQIEWKDVTRPDTMSVVSGPVTAAVVTFTGSAHNIPGTFSCDSGVATCVAPVRYSDGEVDTTATGDWTFVPDEGVSTYTDDETYLTFGWWLDKGADGKPDYLRLIFDATGLGSGDENDTARTTGNTAAADIGGSATYKGAAAGKYAFASTSDATYEGGHFTAMATITADFDADLTPATPANDRGGISLSGMIDNFMTGDMSRPDWMVKLMVDGNTGDDGTTPTPAPVPFETLVGDADSAMTTEWSTGAAANGTGTWTADWYGGGDDGASDAPNAVVGTFDAHIGGDGTMDDGAVGRLQGAFGAKRPQ